IQQAFVEIGALQCGYCTPAQILAAKELLDRNLDPDEAEVRDALSGVLCRCTGYVKPVQAVLRAAAVLRGESVKPIKEFEPEGGAIPVPPEWIPGSEGEPPAIGEPSGSPAVDIASRTRVLPRIQVTPKEETCNSKGVTAISAGIR
ncbi:unnamed protein product, partial [marine sediment metagenome]